MIVNGGIPARRPREERDFLAAVEHGQTAVKDGNDITLVTAARDRASAVCALLPHGGAVEDWVGHDQQGRHRVRGQAGAGRPSRSATTSSCAPGARASEDAKDHTLVDPNSDVYRDLADLEVR